MAKVVRSVALASLSALLLASLSVPAQAGPPEGTGSMERLALPERPEQVSVMLELDAVPAAIAWAEAPTTRSKRCRYHDRLGYILLRPPRADGSLRMVGNAIRTLCSHCYANSD